METTVFNPIQRHLLEMFSYDKSQEGLEELKEVLFQYYSKRMNTKLDERMFFQTMAKVVKFRFIVNKKRKL